MHIFYTENITNNLAELDPDESRHLHKVLRLKNNDPVWVTDGNGQIYNAQIEKSDIKNSVLTVISESDIYQKPDYYIHIAVSPTKNTDRIEWFVEKAVEFGIDEISFLKSDRSERKHINTDRLARIAKSAMKQSLKGTLVKINELEKFRNFILNTDQEQSLYIGHLEEGKKDSLMNLANKNGKYLVLIGPEGDFSPDELALAKEQGFQSITLGNSRLRTETAALAACHILNIINQL